MWVCCHLGQCHSLSQGPYSMNVYSGDEEPGSVAGCVTDSEPQCIWPRSECITHRPVGHVSSPILLPLTGLSRAGGFYSASKHDISLCLEPVSEISFPWNYVQTMIKSPLILLLAKPNRLSSVHLTGRQVFQTSNRSCSSFRNPFRFFNILFQVQTPELDMVFQNDPTNAEHRSNITSLRLLDIPLLIHPRILFGLLATE